MKKKLALVTTEVTFSMKATEELTARARQCSQCTVEQES
jgi:hypothetical protein